jgi:Family of unknown function (DUF6088)
MTGTARASSIATQALRRIESWGRGRVFVPRDLLDLGDRGAVDVTLHRLVAADRIRRLARGLYDYPRSHPRFGRLTPSIDDIARAIARSTNEAVVVSDATAANMLGLSTQVPARPVYLTDGATRNVRVGNQVIRFKHAAPSRMLGRDTKPGLVLRALRFRGRDGFDDGTIAHLRSILNDADRGGLRELRPDAPSWMQSIIDRVVNSNSSDDDISDDIVIPDDDDDPARDVPAVHARR